jgi:RimJ/RimL family protein N-acetyltransferase
MTTTELGNSPPYRIQTERLVLRCWEPADAPLLKDAVDSSLDHLRPWMPWAHEEPRPLSEKVRLLQRFRGRFDLGEDFVYGIFAADESEVVGGAGLHTRTRAGSFEIGYWIRASRDGQGLATETAAALTRAAFALCGVDRLEIHVDPANTKSCKIPEKLGYRREATLRRRLPPVSPGAAPRDEVIFSLLADEFQASALVAFPLEAYDGAANRVL